MAGRYPRDRHGNGQLLSPTLGGGGGVLLYVKEGLKAVKAEVEVFYLEHVWCRISNANGNLLVGVCYRSPNEDIFGKDTMFI